MLSKKLIPRFDKNAGIEYRLFEITLVLTLSVFIFWCIYSLIADYDFTIKVIYFSALFLYSSIYVAYKLGTSFRVSTAIYYSIALIILTYSWLPAGGISGAIIQMFILIYASGLMVLPLRSYLIFIAASLIIVLIFAYQELTVPGLAAPYLNEMDRIRDLSIANVITLCILGYGLYVFKKTYSDDRVRLKETIQELEIEKEKALSADKSKSNFLATISHEMRTPLNGIVGISELLKETELDIEQEGLVSNLAYSSKLLYSLISDILDVTLIESGKIVFKENEIQIGKEVENLIRIVRPKLLKKEFNVELLVQHAQEIPEFVIGDALRFKQVLLNLINNAIKFTEKGSITVSSELVEPVSDFIKIRYTITDTGTGIPEDKKSELFTRFYKAKLDSNIEGTGLGLSISKNLVNLMGGAIGFESKEGIGSTFYFEIPFKKFTPKKELALNTESTEKSFKDIKILVAEDVRINQIVLKKMIEGFGVTTIDLAEHGEKAVEKATQEWYDLILMDIQMPIMDGIEASALISKHYEGRKKPVILAITANVIMTNQEKPEDEGIDGIISKPITKEALKETLNKYI